MSDMKMLVMGVLIGICLGLGLSNLCHCCCDHACAAPAACEPCKPCVCPVVTPKIGAEAPE